MHGPLKVVVRNLTDKPVAYPTSPTLYIQANSEYVLDFDPFTRWADYTSALEPLLVDARKGIVQIIYALDSDFVSYVPCTGYVQLSLIAQRRLNMEKPAPPIVAPEAELPKRVPFGKTVDDMVEDERKDLSEEEKEERRKRDGELKEVDLGKRTSTVSEELNVGLEPDHVVKPPFEPKAEEKVEVKEATPKRGGRRKKEVVSL